MKNFKQYREENLANPTANSQSSPMNPVAQPQANANANANANDQTQSNPQPQKKDLNQLVILLSRKLGTKAQEYKNLLNDIKPENIAKFYELIENLSTLKQTVGAKVVNQANQKMSQ